MAQNPPKVGFISLGCPTAGSDTGMLITKIRAEGYEISSTFKDSDLVIVNTCGFIDSAIHESLEAIREARDLNDKVIVTGCLGEKKKLLIVTLIICLELLVLKPMRTCYQSYMIIFQNPMIQKLI